MAASINSGSITWLSLWWGALLFGVHIGAPDFRELPVYLSIYTHMFFITAVTSDSVLVYKVSPPESVWTSFVKTKVAVVTAYFAV